MANEKQAPTPAGANDKAAIESAIEQIGNQIKMAKSFDVSGAPDGWHSGIDGLQRKINSTLGDTLGRGTPEHKRLIVSEQDFVLDTTFGNHYSVAERKEKIREGIVHAVANLGAAQQVLAERLAGLGKGALSPTTAPTAAPTAAPKAAPTPAPTAAPTPAPPPTPPPTPAAKQRMPMPPSAPVSSPPQPAAISGRVVVLGMGGNAAGQACEFVEQLGLDAAVLDTVSVEQLESLRDTAFLLLLPGGDAEAAPAMLAIGFMLAVLGRSRIACLQSGQAAVPALLQGATNITIDESGLWRLLLAREMKRAGLDVDLNRAL
jgi:hypothetical protein